MTCHAVQYSDQMNCHLCSLAWDVNDPEPPHCAVNVYFDCDNVLLDWTGGFAQWLRVQHSIRVDPAGPSAYSMDAWVGRPSNDLVVEFNSSRASGQLSPMQGAIETVQSLTSRRARMRVISASAPPGQVPTTLFRKMNNLVDVFGRVFEKVEVLPLGTSKGKILRDLPRGYWIEDNYFHAIDGHNAGHTTFLLRQSHNAGTVVPAGLTAIDSLPQILSHIE